MPLPRETRTDDLDLLPLSERKRMLIYPDMPSKGLNVKQVIPGFNKEWPGLPKGVKFDPSDEELLWHLLAEIGKGVPKRHPFIHEFIVSLNENDALGNVHPQFLPGVKQDGSISYFFHRKVEMCSSRKLKRQKKHDNSVEICWHSIVKLNIVCLDGIHNGSKEVLNLYMNPVNGGNPVKTPWLMHQYHIGIDGAEEDLAVSKIFYEMRSKQDVQDSRTDSVDGFVAETVAVAAPLQVAPEFHEGLHVESVSADTSIQVSATHTPAEMTIKELSQNEVDHGIGSETNVEHVGYLKSARSQKHPTTWLEKAIINHDMHSEGAPATDQLPLLESSCETAAEISTFSTSAKSGISDNDQKECVMVKRTDGFLANVGDFGISINNSNYDKVIGDDTLDSNDAHISMEKSCPEKAPEHVLQKNVVDKMFKTPAYSLKGKSLEETESKIAFQKNFSNWVNISAQSALPIKTEPKSFEDTEIGIPSEKFSNNRSSTSASSGLLIKVKPEPFEEAEGSIILENKVDKFTSFSQSSGPVNSSNSVNFCISKTNIQEKIVPHFYISEEGIRSCNLSRQAYIPEDLHSLSVEISSNKISSLDELNLETTGLINQHPEKNDNGHDGLLTSNDNSQVLGDSECHLQINVHAGEPQSNSVSSSSSPNVKYEPVESSLLSCSKISLCDTRGHPSLIFENKSELYSDSPLDILDHVPLKYRFGISVSDGDVNVKSGNISEAPVTPGRCSFGSVNTEECISFSRRKRKKTATNSVERAMEEDAPGLLKVLLDRGVQVEEIKLYGDLEDSDLPVTSSSEGSFEELETVMTKRSSLVHFVAPLFSERSSFLRLTLGRTVKGSRAIYCLASLISLIEQARYLLFRRTPVDWGWCRDLQSFIFVFQTHNRIVLERPEYGYATYFFELVDSLPIDWQIKRLVKAMKLTNCCRTILLENRPIIAGEDISEGEARVLEAYGWARNTGFGTLLNYVDRVVHDRRDVVCSSEWRAKIGKMLMSGYDGGRMVLANIPEKVLEYLRTRSSEIIRMEL